MVDPKDKEKTSEEEQGQQVITSDEKPETEEQEESQDSEDLQEDQGNE